MKASGMKRRPTRVSTRRSSTGALADVGVKGDRIAGFAACKPPGGEDRPLGNIGAPMTSSWRWIVPLALAAFIWLLPHGGFDGRSWGLLCLFAATICALITRPIAAGALMITTIAI